MHGWKTTTGALSSTGTGTGKTEIAFECARRLVGQLLSPERMKSPSKMDEMFSADLILNAKKIPFCSKQIETTATITKKISFFFIFQYFVFGTTNILNRSNSK